MKKRNAVVILGATNYPGQNSQPVTDAIVHVFANGELESTMKLKEMPLATVGELQNFLTRYTNTSVSILP